MTRLEVQFVNRECAYVFSYGSRDLIEEIKGRPPVWPSLRCAWVMTPRAARDLIAAAGARRFEVTVTEGDPVCPSGGRLW